jgi:hypothetical protein
VFSVEFHHDEIVIVEVAGGNPAALLGAVTDPVGQVLELPAEKARVEYARNLVLLFSVGVDDGGQWCEGVAGWQGVVEVWFEEGGVKDGVDAHGWREGEAEGRTTYGFDDWEGPQTFVVQLVAGAVRMDVAAEKPDE